MEELNKVGYYVDGLKQQTHAELIYKPPQTLAEAVTAATNYDATIFGIARSKPNQSNQNQNRYVHSRT